MASPYLSFRELQKSQDRTGEIYAGAIQSLGNSAANLASKYKKAKEDSQNMIFNPLNDINQIQNDTVKLYGIYGWSQIKDEYVPILKEKRGFLKSGILSSEERMNIQSKFSSLNRELEYLNQTNKAIDAAKQKAISSKYYEFNDEAEDSYMKAMTPESGIYNWSEISKAVSDGMRSETGMSFLNYRKVDVPNELNNKFNLSQTKLEKKIKEDITTKLLKGESITTDISKYEANPAIVRAAVNAEFSKDPQMALMYESNLMKTKTPEEIKMATELYPESNTPLLQYSIDNYQVQPSREFVKTTTKPDKLKSEPASSKKELTNLLAKQGNSRSNAFGLTSNNFVDYSQASSRYRNLYNFIPPKGSEEYSAKEKDGVFLDVNVKSSVGTGFSSDYEIVGHDKENGNFWIVPSKKNTEESMGKQIPIEQMISVPEDYILDYYDAKTDYKKPEQKKEDKPKFTGVPEGGF